MQLFIFYFYLMLNACVQRLGVMKNFRKFYKFFRTKRGLIHAKTDGVIFVYVHTT